MTEQSSQLDHNNKEGILLVAGYWENESIDELSQALACKVSLLEPDPTQYALKTRKKMDANWTIHNWTLGNNNGLTKFYLFKPARLSSTMKPKGLARIYRNHVAKEVDNILVKTLSESCVYLGVIKEKNNGLLVGMNASLQFFSADEETQRALQNFEMIRIKVANNELYAADYKIGDVVNLLQTLSFDLVKKSTPDILYTEYVFKRNLQAVLIEEQKQILAERENENVILKSELEKWQEKCLNQEHILEQNKETAKKLNENFQTIEQLTVHQKSLESSMKQQKADYQSEIEKLIAESNKTRQNLDTEIEKNESASHLIEQLREDSNQVQLESKVLKERIKEANKSIEELQVSISKVNEDKISVQNELINVTEELNETKQRAVESQAKYEELSQTIIRLNEEKSKDEDEIVRLTNEVSTLKLNLKNKESQCSNAVNELAELQVSQKSILEDNVRAQNDVKRLNADLEVKDQRLKEINFKQQELASTIDQLNSDKAKDKDEIGRLTTEVSSLKSKLEQSNIQHSNTVKEMERENTAKLKSVRENLEKQIQSHKEQKTRAENSIHKNNELNQKLEKTENELNSLQKEFNSYRSQLESLEIDKKESQKREEQQSRSIELTTKLLSKMQSENEYLSKQYAEKISSENELRQLIGELHEKLEMAANFYQQLEKEHPELVLEHRGL
ncbi:hypothetical protein Q4567_00100 [Aliiglaciecola sp. 2_MG-2023]|uniref:hypothetical protein n=1 Tax=unclassified Aliiglaciecola TaxID=2593648 RepID=UPI0026E482EC|nr:MULTISPECIES: hypothetical protein [unclassified Aliiglaciecola]MDO6709108.1 hypothetical protein [Aliiglaciecola sp. 2_MG-2023]MDO6750256.1 hypothetical protein [Aliiglaciecola sp. 1_MG-2023]